MGKRYVKAPYTCPAIDQAIELLQQIRKENGDLRAEAKAHALENDRMKKLLSRVYPLIPIDSDLARDILKVISVLRRSPEGGEGL